MTALEWIRFIIGALFLVIGAFVMATAVIGNYRFRNALARMHAAGLGDTLGIVFILAGAAVLRGSAVFVLKLAVTAVLLWITSPACSHVIMKMMIETGNNAAGEKEGKNK